MTWTRGPAAAALAEMFAAADPLISVFDHPPETLNAPALVCTDPASVQKRVSGMGVDRCEFIVTAVTALELSDALVDIMDTADKAILADPTLGGVARSAMVTEYRNWRPLNIGGANFRAADLAVRIDM